jgi:hypothetical protein
MESHSSRQQEKKTVGARPAAQYDAGSNLIEVRINHQ